MSRIGRLWTDSVAYVALILGAVTSIAGNVANVLRVRGDLTDGLDLFLAGFFPGLVVLMVEVFVSSRWRGLTWPMQVLRWAGCAAVTVVAMRVSWVHLHALMVSRGQEADVAILGPLAIDFLAIMATALILAGRGQAKPELAPLPTAAEILAERQDEVDRLSARTQVVLPDLAGEAQHYLDRLSAELDASTTPAALIPVSPAPRSNEIKPESVPADAADMIMTWAKADAAERPAHGQVDAIVAGAHGVSTRTARRWRDALLKTRI